MMAKRTGTTSGWHYHLFRRPLPWWAVALGLGAVLGAAAAASYAVYAVEARWKYRQRLAVEAEVEAQQRVYQPGEIVTLANQASASRVIECRRGTNALEECTLVEAAPPPGRAAVTYSDTVLTMTRNENIWRDEHDLPRIFGKIDPAELARMRAGWTPPATTKPAPTGPAATRPASAPQPASAIS